MITLNAFAFIGCGAAFLLALILWSVFRDFISQRKNRANEADVKL